VTSGALSSGIKRFGLEADDSPSSTVEVKNLRIMSAISHTNLGMTHG
jgi:hypothetical protein